MFLSFLQKIYVKAKNPPFLKNPPLCLTPPILEKIFHLYPYCQIRGSQSHFLLLIFFSANDRIILCISCSFKFLIEHKIMG